MKTFKALFLNCEKKITCDTIGVDSAPGGRIEWVDIVKFLLIFFVVAGHSASPYNRYLYLFHIPGFFFISGYLARFNNLSTPAFLGKKAQTLLLPYFSINLLFYLLCYLLNLTSMGTLFFKEKMTLALLGKSLSDLVKHGYTMDIGGASWFLIVLFFSAVVGKIAVSGAARFKVKDWVVLLFCLGLYLVSSMLHARRIFLPYMCDLGLHAFFYYLLGYYFKKYRVFRFRLNHVYALPLSVFILFFFAEIWWTPMNWPTRDFTFPLNLFTSMAGIYLCYLAARVFETSRTFTRISSYVGARTLSILMFHFLGFRLFYYLMYRLGHLPISQVNELVLPYPNSLWFLATVFGIGFSLIIEWGIRHSPTLSFLLLGQKMFK